LHEESGVLDGKSKYYIVRDGKKYAIFNIDDPHEPVSQWWDQIHLKGLVNGKSEYYIVVYDPERTDWLADLSNSARASIFHISNPNKPISGWWNEIYENGLVEGVSDYYIVHHDGKEAIFHKDNPYEPVSQWWKTISHNGLCIGWSNYYIATNDNDQCAIFYKDNPNEPVSLWWDGIYEDGLVHGKSEYYIVQNSNMEEAIFHINNPNTPVSEWWNQILLGGLYKGSCDYYIAQDSHKQYAIFHKDIPEEPVSNWWDEIHCNALFQGTSYYYIAQVVEEEGEGTKAIFHIDNPDEPISDWHFDIAPLGLLNGTTQCYAVMPSENSNIQVYHVNDTTSPLYEIPFKDISFLLHIDDKIAIYVKNRQLMIYDALWEQEKTIAPLSDKTAKLVYSYTVDTYTTDNLIHKYLQNDFIPIVFNNSCCLYTLNSDSVKEFDSTQNAERYIREIILNKEAETNIMRLY